MDDSPYFAPPARSAPSAPQRYGPAPASPEPTTTIRWLKALAVVATTLLSLPAAALAGFAAIIVYSGCFIGCNPESADPFGGAALAGLAALLCAAGPLLAAALYRSRAWLWVGIGVFGLGCLATTVLLSQS